MELTIINCNNIDFGKIQITQSKLNIKFGINGTGKSTVTKAIKYAVESPDKLKELTPFKIRNIETEKQPVVVKPDEVNSVFIFNEDYLNQFLYKQDELISNSFEIFIKTPYYIQSNEKIEAILTDIKNVFLENQQLEQIINDFGSLTKSFTTTQTGLSKTSSVYKGLKDGNRLQHIPEHLIRYKPFIKDKNCISWLDWQIKGSDFIDISDDCPYCTSPTTEFKETIKSVSKSYDKNVIKNFNVIIDAINSLGEYFSEDAKRALKDITEKQTGLDDSETNYIVGIKQQIDDLLSKLQALKYISPKSFKDDEKAGDKLKKLMINIEVFDRFKSTKTKNIVDSLNGSLSNVLTQIGMLQGEINKQKTQTKKLILQHQEEINAFLNNAGYKYLVEITENDAEDYKLRLRHIESNENIIGGNQHLSFGEKNAFALVLFMYEALSKNPDLIVLDDPISSFDKNKKYAIMHMLFRGDKCLKNKTVLMLTHDLDPIVDSVKVLKEFKNLTDARYILTKNGQLTEKIITKNDLLTFPQICQKVIGSSSGDIIKLIYLRRKYELIDDLGHEYQVLSNLFHKRNREEIKDYRKEIGNDEMQVEEFSNGVIGIQQVIPTFEYDTYLNRLLDTENIKELYKSTPISYEKLHLFRILYEENMQNFSSVLRKFINETYHIENEMVCQLDPTEFDLVPDHIITECDNYVLTSC
jgi:ABC-type Mn2+/Zn2+ transport system ATPase subunit